MRLTASNAPVVLAAHASNLTSPASTQSSAHAPTWRGRLAIGIVIVSLIGTMFWAAFLVAVAAVIAGRIAVGLALLG